MKKITVMILTLAMLLSLTACDNSENLSDSGGSSEVDSQNMGNSGNSESSENSDDISDSEPVRPKPDGEPTFLICPDGEPVYTSEISGFYKYGERVLSDLVPDGEGSLENFEAIECDGFVYGYIPKTAFNFVENPELFDFQTYDSDDRKYHYYNGEEYPKSSEYIRIYEGDKFGTLTVSRAYSIFSGEYRYLSDEEKALPGAYLMGGCLEFEGEIELTGYMLVEVDTLYNSAGDLYFFPDSKSSTAIPDISYHWDSDEGELYYEYFISYAGFYGICYGLGNMNDYDIDLDGLKPGDDFVKVKVTLGDISVFTHDMLLNRSNFTLKSVEKI